MDVNEKIQALEKEIAEQKKELAKQQNRIRRLDRKVVDSKLKLFAIQAAIVSDEISPTISSVEHIKEVSSSLAVYSFGGMQTKLGMPPKEFLRSLSHANADQVFFKDFLQCWYHKGLLGHTHNISETIDFIRNLKYERSHDSVISLGTSAGGYAAILFGVAIKAKRILAFVPQTKIDSGVFSRFKSISSLNSDFSNLDESYLDLQTYLSSQSKLPIIDIYYGQGCEVDEQAAKHLEGFKNVFLHPVKGVQSHGETLRVLKESGQLNEILREAVSEIPV